MVATLCSFFVLGAEPFDFLSTSLPLYAISFMPNPGIKGYLLPSGLSKNFYLIKNNFKVETIKICTAFFIHLKTTNSCT
jgi:hypothetical protein